MIDRPFARRDIVLAAIVTLAFVVESALSKDAKGSFVSDALLYGSAGAALLWRRRYPVAVQLGTLALAGVAALLGTGVTHIATALVLLVVPSYSVGHETEGRRSWLALLGGVALMAFATQASEGITFSNTGFPAGVMVAAWTCGRLLRTRMQMTRALADEAARLEIDRDLRAQAAVGEERARIAREIHDVIAHTMAIMVIQAGAARKVLDADPAAAEDSLTNVERTGRVALTELRRLLGFLRQEEPAALAPQPKLDEIETLVRRAREAGLKVELRVEGEPGELPSGAELAAYRIIQEALTNTIKHAGAGARASVVVRWTAEELEIQVRDSGGTPGSAQPGGQHGLVGMRERVALYGGHLQAGPHSGGGFAVRASIPRSEVLA